MSRPESVSTRYRHLRHAIRETLDRDRYHHSIGVAYTASCLAMRYHADPEKAFLAGLLHDNAKLDRQSILMRAEKHHFAISETEQAEPMLMHGRLGAFYAKEKYGVMDPEVLSAIEWHTVGKPGMTVLEMILYVADYIEPNRTGLSHLDEIRDAAFVSLEKAVHLIADATMEHVKEKGGVLDPRGVLTAEYYRQF